MFDHHDALLQALRPGRANVILTHHFQHRRTRHARRYRRITVADGDDGKDQLGEVLPRILPERDEHQRRAPLEVDHQEEDDQNPGPERRNGQAPDADDAHAIVNPGILTDGRQRAQRNGDDGGDQRREEGDLQGQGQADPQFLEHRGAAPQRSPEVQVDDTPDPGQELLIERAVEPHFCSQALEILQVDIAALLARAENQQGDVARDHVHQQEDHQGCPEQGRDHEQDTFDDVLPHRFEPSISRAPFPHPPSPSMGEG